MRTRREEYEDGSGGRISIPGRSMTEKKEIPMHYRSRTRPQSLSSILTNRSHVELSLTYLLR